MSLKDFTNEELKRELGRRKKVKSEKPEWEPLVDLCQRYVDDLARNGYVYDYMTGYIFEAALKAVFGKDIFDWINKVSR